MEYEKMLERALERVPKRVSRESRFKVPEVICEVQGNKTILRNFSDFVNTFRRDKKHLAKYLSKELAAPSTFQGQMLVFNSIISKEAIKKKIESYLKEFVYCRECGEPDTKLIKEDNVWVLKCEACGARTYVRKI